MNKVIELKSYRKQIDEWLTKQSEPMATRLRDINPGSLWDIEAGDTLIFKNGYGVRMKTTVVGFARGASGEIYLDWDCYWFPIREDRIESVIRSKK